MVSFLDPGSLLRLSRLPTWRAVQGWDLGLAWAARATWPSWVTSLSPGFLICRRKIIAELIAWGCHGEDGMRGLVEVGAQGLSLGHIPQGLDSIAVWSADQHCDLEPSPWPLGSLLFMKNLGFSKFMSFTRHHLSRLGGPWPLTWGARALSGCMLLLQMSSPCPRSSGGFRTGRGQLSSPHTHRRPPRAPQLTPAFHGRTLFSLAWALFFFRQSPGPVL